MNIKEIIRNLIESVKMRRKSKSELARLGAQKVQETLEQLEGNEAYDEATKIVIKEIKKCPELAIKILKNIKEVSTEVAVEAVKQLPSEEQFTGKIAVNAAKQIDFGDEQILEIISNSTELDYEEKVQIANQLNNDKRMGEVKQELKEEEEQRILDELQQIYEKCNEGMNDAELEEQLNKVTESIHVHTQSICTQRNRIIARKIAFNYAIFGTNIVSKQRGLMTPKQMYENGIVQIAKEEYEKIVEEYGGIIKGKKIREFNVLELENNIVEEIKATEINTDFDEEVALARIMEIMKATMKPDERRDVLEYLEQGLGDKESREAYLDIIKSDVINLLVKLPKKERKDTLETVKNAIDKRNTIKNKNVNKGPEVKAFKFNDGGR